MGRSVSYASGSVAVAYRTHDCEEDFDFQWYIEDLQESGRAAFPSMQACDVWIDREDRAILENNLAYIGISEYCGLVSVWLLPKEFTGGYDDDARNANLAAAWCAKVKPKFMAMFGELRKVGQFSNGEVLFERRA